LTAPDGKKSIHSLQLRIVGKVDGRGRVEWAEAGKSQEVSGAIDLNWSNEWYASDCEIAYVPIGAASGELRIFYNFEEI
jgi:hypothetical protein